MERNNGSAAIHGDPGLQPERTTLAWGRTMFALVTASAISLRWLPQHGLPILLLFAVATAAAAAIYFTQRRRYSATAQGIVKGMSMPIYPPYSGQPSPGWCWAAWASRLSCSPLDTHFRAIFLR